MSRLILHSWDPLVPAPGGIDTCIRGILKYGPDDDWFVLGVDGTMNDKRSLGRWETHDLGGREVRFMAVTRLDPGNQIRRIPHSLRIAAGAWRYRARIPRVDVVQSHRADLGFVGRVLWPRPERDYFIHTQEDGLLGVESDSFWRRASVLHRRLERRVARDAQRVRVFNPTYAPIVAEWNAGTAFSPTWWDPGLVRADTTTRGANEFGVLWVGRLEQPKMPELALEVIALLKADFPEEPWTLKIVGAGNLLSHLQMRAEMLGLSDRVTFAGRLAPEAVMEEMAGASVLLMTSVEGYEGYPRVLVEGLASGLSAVVTHGSDTGSLVTDGVNGYRASAIARDLAGKVRLATRLDRQSSRRSVDALSAPVVIAALYAQTESAV